MPIDVERFERVSSFQDGETNAEQVLSFLVENDERAYRRGEIADATGIDPDVVSAVLHRLSEAGRVRHKRPYWAAVAPEGLQVDRE